MIIKPLKRSKPLASQDNTYSAFANLTINGKGISYVQNTTVLGLCMDDKLTSVKHATRKLQQCWHTWYGISKNTTRHRGLNISSLVILFKTIVLSKLLYAAPVWLNNQAHIFKKFYSRVCLKISGSTHFPQQNLALVSMGLEPLSVRYDVMVVKFILKSLHSDGNMNGMILQIEGSRTHPFYHHTSLVKKYLKYKDNSISFGRSSVTPSLAEIDESFMYYTKADMEHFKSLLWNELLGREESFMMAQDRHGTSSSPTVPMMLINIHKQLFHRTSSRMTDTKVMIMIHGHSRHFNSFKHSLGLNSGPLCNSCGIQDNNLHQLLECPKYNSTYREPLQTLITDSTIWTLILEADAEQISCFRNMAQIILHNPNRY